MEANASGSTDLLGMKPRHRLDKRFLMMVGIALTAFLVRLSVMSHGQSMADPYSYANMALEILKARTIPSRTTLTYPGSQIIVPPLLPLSAAGLSLLGINPLDALLSITLAVSSLTAIPVFLSAEKLAGTSAGAISATLFAFSYPMLYMLTWGAYPNAIAIFFMGWILYVLVADEPRRTWLISVLLSLIAFTHHFTFLITASWLILYALLLALKRERGRSRLLGVNLALALAVSSLWYLPRWPLLLAAGATGSAPSLEEVLSSFSGVQASDLVLVFFAPFGLYRSQKGERMTITSLLLTLTIYLLYASQNPIIGARVLYFFSLAVFILSGAAVPFLQARMGVTALGIILILTFTASYLNSASASTYFANIDVKDEEAIKWLRSNLREADIILTVDDEVSYIAFHTGRATIGSGDSEYAFLPEQRRMMVDANMILAKPSESSALMRQYNITYIVLPASSQAARSVDDAGFTLVYKGGLAVWRV